MMMNPLTLRPLFVGLRLFYLVFIGLFMVACTSSTVKNTVYQTRDYITVGKMMDSIKPPYIVDVASGNKRIVFIGCDHNNDSTHPQYAAIEKYAMALKPQVAFNEGGQIADTIHYTSRNMAAYNDGETGTLKYFADKLGIAMANGDTPFKNEWPLTMQKQTKNDLYLYYIVERFVVPYHYGGYGKQPFDSVFAKSAIPYLLKNGFPLQPQEQTFAWYKTLYKQALHHDFNIEQPDLEAFDYVNDSCHFCAVGRTSKMVRDSLLLNKIATALKTSNRILVTFGHGHALAVEPALKQLVAQ